MNEKYRALYEEHIAILKQPFLLLPGFEKKETTIYGEFHVFIMNAVVDGVFIEAKGQARNQTLARAFALENLAKELKKTINKTE